MSAAIGVTVGVLFLCAYNKEFPDFSFGMIVGAWLVAIISCFLF